MLYSLTFGRTLFTLSAISSMMSSAAAFVVKSRPISSTRLYYTYSPKETAQAAIDASKIMVFAKTYCPHSKKAKEAISKVTPLFSVMELDVRSDGADIQAALLEMTGQRTVPNIFINGKHLGGCDDTLEAIANGSFEKLIK